MTSNHTLLIRRPDIEAVFGISEAISAVEEAFRFYGEGRVQMPPKLYLNFEKGDLRCMPVYMPPLNISGVKNVNVHPDNTDLPTVMATITLIDPETGFPLAILDGTYLTGMRTAAAGAVATKYLSRQDSRTAGFVGAGRQARTQLEGLLQVRPGIRTVLACDLDPSRAEELCRLATELGVAETEACHAPEQTVRRADVLTTTTPTRDPIVEDEWVRPGTHINAIGADAEGKEELAPHLLTRARIVIDNWEQASHSGEINVPLADDIISREDILGDVGELVTGGIEGRTSDEDITIFDSTGLAIQDIATAHRTYRILTEDEDRRASLQSIEFF